MSFISGGDKSFLMDQLGGGCGCQLLRTLTARGRNLLQSLIEEVLVPGGKEGEEAVAGLGGVLPDAESFLITSVPPVLFPL